MATGFLLGAGASYEIGMPLVTELTREFRSYWTPVKLRAFNLHWRSTWGGYSDAVIDDALRVLEDPGMHYEAVLGYLETQYTRPNGLQQQYHGLYSTLVESVYAMLWSRHIRNVPRIVAYLRFLEGVIGLAEANRPLWVFSLNHDVIVECLGLKYGVPVSCGFPDRATVPRRDKTGRKFGDLGIEVLRGEQFDNSGLVLLPQGTRGINLVKVHGGLDIFTFNDGKDLARIMPTAQTPEGLIDALRVAHEEVIYVHPQHGKLTTPNEILYGDDQNDMQFLRRTILAGAFKFDGRHQQVLPTAYLDIFAANLNHVTELICIGYGFADLHINAILRKWLEVSAERKLEIVSPGAKDIPAFLTHLTPQVAIVPLTATSYLEQYALSPLSVAEQALKGFCDGSRAGGAA